MAGIILNGSVIKGLILNGSPVTAIMNGVKVFPTEAPVDPYNPLGLPPNTVRVRTSDGLVPKVVTGDYSASYETATLVAGTTDVYDVYKSGTDFTKLLCGSTNVVEVLGANTTGIVNMNSMLYSCSSITTIALFDTSNVTDVTFMCGGCSSLTTIPLFDTSKVTRMNNMFSTCMKVESGALALYQQASSQTIPPASHSYAFRYCGMSTTNGAAELAQIPAGWK